MPFQRFLARQLGNPSSVLGKLFLAPVWNRRNAALNDFALQALSLTANERVLEIGFGGGYLLDGILEVVTRGFVAGVDVSPAMVALCTTRYRTLIEKGRIEIKKGRAESLPYPANHFSKACSVNSIFYWANFARGIAEAWRVLTPDGSLVFCFTLPSSLKQRGFAAHVEMHQPDEVREVMETQGFRDIVTEHSRDRHREFACMIGRKPPRE